MTQIEKGFLIVSSKIIGVQNDFVKDPSLDQNDLPISLVQI